MYNNVNGLLLLRNITVCKSNLVVYERKRMHAESAMPVSCSPTVRSDSVKITTSRYRLYLFSTDGDLRIIAGNKLWISGLAGWHGSPRISKIGETGGT